MGKRRKDRCLIFAGIASKSKRSKVEGPTNEKGVEKHLFAEKRADQRSESCLEMIGG